MATFDAHANFAYSTVATPPSISQSGTTLTVATGQGALFPSPPFNCTVWPKGAIPLAATSEIVRVTAVSGDTFTILRAQEGSSAANISTGYNIANSVTAKLFTDIQDAATVLTGASLSVTYTGTPVVPFPLQISPMPAYIPAVAGSGTPTVFPQSTEAPFQVGFDYEEGPALPSNIGITSITFNNIVSGANILISYVPNVTSISFPALLDAQSLHIGQCPLLTSVSLPNFVQTTLTPNAPNGSGDLQFISCATLAVVSFPSLTTIGAGIAVGNGGFAILSCPLVTTFSFPVLSVVNGTFSPSNFPILTTFSFPSLTIVTGLFNVQILASITTWNFPLLATVGGNFTPNTFAVLTTLSCPSLSYIGGNFAPATMASLTTWSFPALTTIGGTFAPTTMAALTDLECNALQTVGGAFSIASMANLATVSFSGMVTYGSTIDLHTSNGKIANLTLGTIGTLKAITGATINVSGQALTSASVNAVLALLVSLDGTNGTTLWGSGNTLNISGGTSAAPSGQGVTDKATLVGRGATITTN